MKRYGRGGQAAAMRDKPNAIGIPTLWEPGVLFTDADYNKVAPTILTDYIKAFDHLNEDRIVVWPADGIGTGFASLPIAAPKIWKLVEDTMKLLFEYALLEDERKAGWGVKQKAIYDSLCKHCQEQSRLKRKKPIHDKVDD